jgi:hypothetical protein
MEQYDTAVLTISGVPCTSQDILGVIEASDAFKTAVRMKALERMVTERDATIAAASEQAPVAEPEKVESKKESK